MIVAEKIKSIENELKEYEIAKSGFSSKVRHIISDAQKNNTLCGKCDGGYIRKPFPISSIGDVEIPDFIKKGFPTLCDCLSSAREYETKAFEIEDKIVARTDELRSWQKARSKLADVLGSEYADKGLYNYDRAGNEAAIENLISWQKGGRKTPLMIIGRTGSGKTHILAGIMNQFICDRIDYHYIDGYRIDAMTLMEKHEFDCRLSRMTSADVLIIDDIGKSKMTEALLNHVYFPILHSRRNNRKITIYTSDKIPRKLWISFPDRENVEALYTRIEWIENGSPSITIIPLQRGGENADKE